MGIRHLTIVKKNEEIKVAQYGQWDGYPSGTGFNILEFLTEEGNLTRLDSKIHLCKDIVESSEDFRIVALEEHPEWFNRDTGSDILGMIANTRTPVYLSIDLQFGGDIIFCEWAWVIDLDERKLDAYSGPITTGIETSEDGNPQLITEIVSGDQGIFSRLNRDQTVTRIVSIDLDDLPDQDTFLSLFDDKTSKRE